MPLPVQANTRAQGRDLQSTPGASNGSFGYMQNPMMSGAGMPQALPMQASGTAYPKVPMYEPSKVKPR